MNPIDPTGQVARRFPLVARPRPACTPLGQRLAALCHRADTASRDHDLASASAVFNLAALLASDCGLPDLARIWCHRQAAIYLAARPLSAQAARHALEPLVNLARLHIRAEDGDRAFALINDLYTAVSTRTDTIVDGLAVPAADLTAPTEAHHEARRWLWAVLLATGARALAVAGRWNEAHAQLRRHNGIGRRMLDGRQVAVLALATSARTQEALELLARTQPAEPSENAVTACLIALCRQEYDAGRESLSESYNALDRKTPGLIVFHTGLGLSVVDALGGVERPHARRVASDLVATVINANDGYAAQALLNHDGCASLLGPTDKQILVNLVTVCALGRRELPAVACASLSTSLDQCEDVIAAVLRREAEKSA